MSMCAAHMMKQNCFKWGHKLRNHRLPYMESSFFVTVFDRLPVLYTTLQPDVAAYIRLEESVNRIKG